MKLLWFGAALALVLTGLTVSAQEPAPSTHDADIRELERLETVWNEAHERGDADALEALWADDLEVAVPCMALMTEAAALSFARSGRMKFLRYQSSEIRVRVYDNAAVVTGRLQRTRSMNGREVSDDWRFTKVYVREGHKWRVVTFHASEGLKVRDRTEYCKKAARARTAARGGANASQSTAAADDKPRNHIGDYGGGGSAEVARR
ncbi:MAG: nuclear transport factor 2 family protein [Candidatus Acidiferrales bacterium]